MKTGNTSSDGGDAGGGGVASMEPGHEDREYRLDEGLIGAHRRASMEPGHEDREYMEGAIVIHAVPSCLNGARS